MGTITVSSWSWPIEFCPLRASRPTTVTGTFLMRMVWSTGSRSPKSSRATVCPMMATLAEPWISDASNRRPLASGQSRASR
ncbi:hypothetical protein D9M68_877870 [compost metagenome]